MRSSVIVLASVVGVAIAQGSSVCTDAQKATDCIAVQAQKEASCQAVIAVKACYDDYCPEIPFPDELNSIIDTCENGGGFPGSGSGSGSGSGTDTSSETGTPTGTGSESTSTSSSGGDSNSPCIDRQAYADCVNPLAKKKQTCAIVSQIAECFENYCPSHIYQIQDDIDACAASSTGSGSSSGSTRTTSSDNSESTDFETGVSSGSSTLTSSAADTTGTVVDSGSDENSTTVSNPTNTSTNDNPVSTDRASDQGAADRLFAPVGAIVGTMIAIMAWL